MNMLMLINTISLLNSNYDNHNDNYDCNYRFFSVMDFPFFYFRS